MEENLSNHKHFIVHKPYGFLTQFIYTVTTRKNRRLLGELHDFPDGIMAIGRLDQDSEGLLFLTTNGMVSHEVRSKNVEKEYYVQVDGEIDEEALLLLQNGVQIGVGKSKYTTLPASAVKLEEPPNFPPRSRKIRDERHGPTSWVSITITEGKNRQVRKMTAAAGFPTLRLIRVRIGKTWLENLKSGEVQEVNSFEL